MRVYNLDPSLSQEQKAVVFAKTSRSPLPFDEIAKEVTEQSSSEFHEKWVVGYGHSSVAEHAMLQIAVEDVSMIAAKAIEDCRLGSYTEKSTRYQVYDDACFHIPQELDDHPDLRIKYEQLLTEMVQKYLEWHEELIEILKDENPGQKGYRQTACDQIRDILPIATKTNLGLTMNARSLAHTIRKLKTSRNSELQEVARLLESVGKEQVPTLLKYCEPEDTSNRLLYTKDTLATSPIRVLYKPALSNTRIVNTNEGFLAATDIDGIPYSTRNFVSDSHTKLPRVYEFVQVTGVIKINFGAWRDIQRHRMATFIYNYPSPSRLIIPEGIIKLRKIKEFLSLAYRARRIYLAMDAINPSISTYALMMCNVTRIPFNMNLREAHYFCRLRGGEKAHKSCQIIAHQLWNTIVKNMQDLSDLMPEFTNE